MCLNELNENTSFILKSVNLKKGVSRLYGMGLYEGAKAKLASKNCNCCLVKIGNTSIALSNDMCKCLRVKPL